jgi:hypothetical protein
VIRVDLAPEVSESLRGMKGRGTPPARCHKGVVRSAIAGAVRRLLDGELAGGVRPWDLPALQRGAAEVGKVSAARAVYLDENVLVAELLPSGQRIVLRGVDDEWRLVRFADDGDFSLRPEIIRRVELHGWGPDSVLGALGVSKPEDVELQISSEDLGQGETESRYGYYWAEADRSYVAEEVKNEIFDGATPYSTYVRGVIIDGDRGVFLTGRDGSALIVEG